MEWPRIKNILIVVLIIINIFLIVMISFVNDGNRKVNSTSFDETLKILKMNGISVSCSTDIKLSKMAALTLTYDEKNGTTFYKTGSNNYHELNSKSAKKIADSFIKKHKAFDDIADDLVFETAKPVESGNEIMTYSVSYGGYFNDYRLTDCYLICYVTPFGVSSVERHWAKATESTEAFELVPLSQALLTCIAEPYDNENTIKNQNIIDISIVYSVATQIGENVSSDTAFPTWKITTDQGIVNRVPAYKFTDQEKENWL